MKFTLALGTGEAPSLNGPLQSEPPLGWFCRINTTSVCLSFPCLPVYSGMVFRGGQGIATVPAPSPWVECSWREMNPQVVLRSRLGLDWLYRCNWSELEFDR